MKEPTKKIAIVVVVGVAVQIAWAAALGYPVVVLIRYAAGLFTGS